MPIQPPSFNVTPISPSILTRLDDEEDEDPIGGAFAQQAFGHLLRRQRNQERRQFQRELAESKETDRRERAIQQGLRTGELRLLPTDKIPDEVPTVPKAGVKGTFFEQEVGEDQKLVRSSALQTHRAEEAAAERPETFRGRKVLPSEERGVPSEEMGIGLPSGATFIQETRPTRGALSQMTQEERNRVLQGDPEALRGIVKTIENDNIRNRLLTAIDEFEKDQGFSVAEQQQVQEQVDEVMSTVQENQLAREDSSLSTTTMQQLTDLTHKYKSKGRVRVGPGEFRRPTIGEARKMAKSIMQDALRGNAIEPTQEELDDGDDLLNRTTLTNTRDGLANDFVNQANKIRSRSSNTQGETDSFSAWVLANAKPQGEDGEPLMPGLAQAVQETTGTEVLNQRVANDFARAATNTPWLGAYYLDKNFLDAEDARRRLQDDPTQMPFSVQKASSLLEAKGWSTIEDSEVGAATGGGQQTSAGGQVPKRPFGLREPAEDEDGDRVPPGGPIAGGPGGRDEDEAGSYSIDDARTGRLPVDSTDMATQRDSMAAQLERLQEQRGEQAARQAISQLQTRQGAVDFLRKRAALAREAGREDEADSFRALADSFEVPNGGEAAYERWLSTVVDPARDSAGLNLQ